MRYFEMCRVRDLCPRMLSVSDVVYAGECVSCNKTVEYVVSWQKHTEMQNGKVQDNNPANAVSNEFFISGLCEECQNEVFDEDED